MKLLYLTARFPYPLDKGDKLRDFNHIKGLSKNHSITLVSFINSKTKEEHVNKLRQYCDKIILVKKKTIFQVFKSALSVGTKLPFQVAFYKSDAMAREVQNILATNEFNIVYTHLIRMAQYSISIENIPKVIDLADAISTSLTRRIKISSIFIYVCKS